MVPDNTTDNFEYISIYIKAQDHFLLSLIRPSYSGGPVLTNMSTLEDLDEMERDGDKDEKPGEGEKPADGGVAKTTEDKDTEKPDDSLDAEILRSSTRDINMRRRLLDNDLRVVKSEFQRLTHEQSSMKERIKDNLDKIENNRYTHLCNGCRH